MTPAGGAPDEAARRRPSILAVAPAQRHARIRSMLAALPDVRLHLHDAPIDALLMAMRGRFDLVLLDLSLDAAALALANQLARLAPDTGVMIFDDAPCHAEGTAIGTHCWDDAGAVIQAWLTAQCGSRPREPGVP